MRLERSMQSFSLPAASKTRRLYFWTEVYSTCSSPPGMGSGMGTATSELVAASGVTPASTLPSAASVPLSSPLPSPALTGME